jgi:hypothetical protein
MERKVHKQQNSYDFYLFQILHGVKPAFAEAVRAYYSHPNSLNLVTNDVMATIMAAVVSEITSSVTEVSQSLCSLLRLVACSCYAPYRPSNSHLQIMMI